MLYRSFPRINERASALGMGCMRLPVGADGKVNRPEAMRLLGAALDGGVNYFDTAYPYHGGESERVLGDFLADGTRERVLLTTKLPLYLVNAREDMERLLDEQLARLRTDHVDFYLLHAVYMDRYEKLRALGVREFLDEMKAKGKIRHAGFSFHDGARAFERVMGDYDWDAAQIQMNFLDEDNQATLALSSRLARERGIGLIVMEPLRGGTLARAIPDEARALYDGSSVRRSPAEWALRWALDKDVFSTVLSGMTTMDDLAENLRVAGEAAPGCLSEADKRMLAGVRAAYETKLRVGCTGCGYCLPCPKSIPISQMFRFLDQNAVAGHVEGFAGFYKGLKADGKGADACVACGKCERACPQHLPIREHMAAIRAEFGGDQ